MLSPSIYSLHRTATPLSSGRLVRLAHQSINLFFFSHIISSITMHPNPSFVNHHPSCAFALIVYSDPGPRLLHASERLWLPGAQGPLGWLAPQQHEHLGQLSATDDQPVAVEHDDGERPSQHGRFFRNAYATHGHGPRTHDWWQHAS